MMVSVQSPQTVAFLSPLAVIRLLYVIDLLSLIVDAVPVSD